MAFAALAAVAGAFAWVCGVQAAVLRADPETVLHSSSMRWLALARGRRVYTRRCAACHGPDGRSDQSLGVPDLTDQDHLYGGGEVAEIETIARYGIRSHNKRGWNLALMPAFASARPSAMEPLPSLSPVQIEDLTQFLLSLSGRQTAPAAAARGAIAFGTTASCSDCHGRDGAGDPAIGAPNLTDRVWLYGGSHDAIYRSIAQGRAGSSPAFERVLSPAELRDVAVYVAALAQPSPQPPRTP